METNNLKYLFIVDSYKWALYKRAMNLKKHLNLNAEIIHFNEVKNFNLKNFDIIYLLNWPIYKIIEPYLINKDLNLITTISSHEKNRPINIKEILLKHKKFSVSNIHLLEEYKKYYNSFYYTPFGVDEKIYKKYTNPNEYKNIFGFVGNSDRKEKRFEIIKNIILKNKNAKLITATNKDLFDENQMVDFYNKIGTLICYSSSEGTPNPVLEASACGRNVISTNVGNVSELFKNKNLKDNIIISENDFNLKVNNIINNNIDLNLNGILFQNEIVKNWTWKKQSKNFLNFLKK